MNGHRFILLVFLRAGPDAMPAGWRATMAAALFFFLSGLVMSFVVAEPDTLNTLTGQIVWHSLRDNAVDLTLLTAYFLLLLKLAHRMPRAPQMLTAIFSALGFLGLVLALLWYFAPVNLAEPGPMTLGAGLILALFGWNLLVLGQIVRRTFDWGVWAGMGVALGYFVCSAGLMVWIDGLR
ncbi:MAG TPA: hypothetical protein PK693_06635 [Halothiobacillus sp.]|jgi:hypothetical protein|nr:hypothetical protein [Halothiobacillus sp.]HQS29229.1 hypothetical protein [Halothiobacillus sp.]